MSKVKCPECSTESGQLRKEEGNLQYWRCSFCRAEWTERIGNGK